MSVNSYNQQPCPGRHPVPDCSYSENITPLLCGAALQIIYIWRITFVRFVSHQPVPPSQREILLYHSYVTLLFTYTLLCLLCESVECRALVFILTPSSQWFCSTVKVTTSFISSFSQLPATVCLVIIECNYELWGVQPITTACECIYF